MLGVIGLALAFYAVGKGISASQGAQPSEAGEAGGLFQQDQRDFSVAKYDQRFTLPTSFEDGAGLPARVVDELRPYFSEDFDFTSIRLRNGAPWWAVGDPSAVTFRDTIYLAEGAYNPNTPEGIALIGHEVLHVQQFRDLGTFRFGIRYFGDYLVGRVQGLGHFRAYGNISLGRSAFTLGRRIRYDLGSRG